MKINRKLIIEFVSISLIPVIIVSFLSISIIQETMGNTIGENFKEIIIEKAKAIEFILQSRVDEAELLAESQAIIDVLKESNLKYQNKTDDEILMSINEIDEEWIESNGEIEIANTILNNNLSQFLQKYQNRDQNKYGEIFITDAHGTSVAMTKILSDYYQSDEEWWQYSFDNGSGKTFIDDRGYDLSINAIAVGTVVPIKDQGKVIGILKINWKVESIIDIISSDYQHKSMHSFLARQTGEIIFHKSEDHYNLTDIEAQLIEMEEPGWAEDDEMGVPSIMAYSQIDTEIFSRVPTPGEIRGVSGEHWEQSRWIVFLEITKSDAFAPINDLNSFIIIIGFLIGVGAAFIAFLSVKPIIKAISDLQRSAKDIAKGKLNTQIKPKSKDEVGDLAKSFETMRLEVKHSRDNFEEKIKERTKELEKKIEELEKFKKITIGRELQMTKLKKEINELLEKLGEKPRYSGR